MDSSYSEDTFNNAILLLVFNRLDTTIQVLNAIRKAKPPRLYIASDGFRKNIEGEESKVESVRRYVLDNIDWECEIKTFFREQNLGCKIAVSSAISWFFKYENEGIILEDDCVPHESFFFFCQEMLQEFQKEKDVWMISGFHPRRYGHASGSYFKSINPSVWGWATWKDRWAKYSPEIEIIDFFKIISSTHIPLYVRIYFLKNLFKQFMGKIDSWAYPLSILIVRNKGFVIKPFVNLIMNIGTHGQHASGQDKNHFTRLGEFKVMSQNLINRADEDDWFFESRINKTFLKGLLQNFNRYFKRKHNKDFVQKLLQFQAKSNILSREHKKPNALSIIIPCYNHGDILEETIYNVLMMEPAPDEVIFIDDASFDDTSDILRGTLIKQLKEKTKVSVIINQKNLGQAGTINKGVQLSQNEIITILNDDDKLAKDFVLIVRKVFEENEVELFGGHSEHFNSNQCLNSLIVGEYFDLSKPLPVIIKYPEDISSYETINSINMTHSGTTFTKKAWESVGGYFTNKSQRIVPYSDRDFQLRVNSLFPIAILENLAISSWRNDKSVDAGINS